MVKRTSKDANGNEVVEQFDETQAPDPRRVPDEPAMPKVVAPEAYEHDALGTTDGEEPRVVAHDLLKEIQRPVKPSALNPNSDNKDALIGDEDEDVDVDRNSRVVTQDPRADVPEVNGVRVVQKDEEPVVDDASHVAGASDEEKAEIAQVAQPVQPDSKQQPQS